MFNSNGVERAVIDTKPLSSVFLFDEKDGGGKWTIARLDYPGLEHLFNLSFNLFFLESRASIGPKRDMGLVLGRSGIRWSTVQ